MTTSKPPLQTDIAKALGIAPSRVTALKLLGMPTTSTAAALAWRQEHLHPGKIKSAQADGPTNKSAEGESFSAARGRREIAEADKAEIELAQLQGLLINRAGIEMAMETAFRQIRDTILSTPDRLPIDATHRAIFRNALRDTLTDSLKMLPTTMASEQLQA